MNSLASFLAKSSKNDIQTISHFIQQHIDAQWEAVFEENRAEIFELFAKIGDSAYGMYGQRLFQPIHEELKAAGFRSTPKLPGNLNISREWGPEDVRERWMWSKITRQDGSPVGTIVTLFYHDHTQIRIPRAFRVIPLEVTSKGEVIKALSQLEPAFKDAIDFQTEVAQYMATLKA